jgi:Family of unknown function (DUF6464)
MSFIGDTTCKYNALSSEIRCAVNPDGPCKGCQYFEPVRERIMFIGKPVAPMSRQELLAHKIKTKIYEIWSVVRYPVGMLQIICGLTILGLLISNKYPISKEHFLELFKSNTRIVGLSYSLFREFNVLTEFQFHGRHRTFLNKILRILEPLAWLLIIEAAVNVILKSSVY